MNAKFLEHFIAYREEYGLDLTKTILLQKIKYQFAIVGEKKSARPFLDEIADAQVDDVLLKLIRKKKLPLSEVDPKMISSFVYRMKKKGETRYFHKELGYCVELNYWLRLLLLEFMGAVRFQKNYHPTFPSLRHESRCMQKKEKTTSGMEVAR